MFSDDLFANMAGGGSQGGYINILSDALRNNMNNIAWQSHRIKRIVNGTLAAEAMALNEALGKAVWIR